MHLDRLVMYGVEISETVHLQLALFFGLRSCLIDPVVEHVEAAVLLHLNIRVQLNSSCILLLKPYETLMVDHLGHWQSRRVVLNASFALRRISSSSLKW